MLFVLVDFFFRGQRGTLLFRSFWAVTAPYIMFTKVYLAIVWQFWLSAGGVEEALCFVRLG